MNSIQQLKQRLNALNVWDKELTLKRWEYLKKEGTTDINLYFIEKGCVRAYFLEGTYEHSLYFGHEGSLVSDLGSFLSESPSAQMIQCVNNTKVKVISKATFIKFLKNDPSFSELWITVLSELSLWHIERQKDLMINSPKERFERILKRQPLLLQKVPHKYIASYLRMTPESLSRLQNS